MKYFISDDKTKLRVDKDHWYLKTTTGEKELPFPSKVATDIILENNSISKAEYDK